jgi:hypothetical protein
MLVATVVLAVHGWVPWMQVTMTAGWAILAILSLVGAGAEIQREIREMPQNDGLPQVRVAAQLVLIKDYGIAQAMFVAFYTSVFWFIWS